ncbi:MAG: transposase [Fluviicola sp.]|nr:transposase [Fluviicola sp.]
MNKVKTIRYSEAFKLEVVKDYEESQLTRSEVSEKYGIKGGATLSCWLRKYGKKSSLNKIIRVEKPEERNQLKSLQLENDKLKKALADSYIKQITSESFLEAASELMGLTVEELKKKFGEKS